MRCVQTEVDIDSGHYYSALRSVGRIYDSIYSTWPQIPSGTLASLFWGSYEPQVGPLPVYRYVRLDATLKNVRLRHPKNRGETEETRRKGFAATSEIGLLAILNRHFESEDAPMATAHREYIRKNQRSFEETMLMEEHDCEEHIRHQVHLRCHF